MPTHMCIHMYIHLNVCMSIYIYTYIYICTHMWRKIESKVIQCEEFSMIESQRYNVSVSIYLHQDLEKMLSSVVNH